MTPLLDNPRLQLLAALAVGAAVFFLQLSIERDSRGGRTAGDLPLVNRVVAQSTADTGMYGVEGVPMPVVREGLWRWGAGRVAGLTGSTPQNVMGFYALAASVLLLWLLVKVLSLQYPQYAVISWAGGLLLALSPPLVGWNVDGLSGPFAALLVLLAVVVHMSSSGEGRPLPLTAAACIGLAAMLRLEFIAVWGALFIHGLMVGFSRRRTAPLAAVILGFLAGALMISVFLAPLINWNFRVIEVPWPRSFDSALALGAGALDSSADSPASFGAILAGAISGTYRTAFSAGMAGSFMVRLFAALGVGYWLLRSRGGSRDNYACLAAVLLLTPLFHAFFVPFVGWSGAVPVYEALAPVWVLAVVAGIAALQHLLDPVLRRLIPVFPDHLRYALVLGLFSISPLLDGALLNRTELVRQRTAAEAMDASFNEVKNRIEEAGIRDPVMLTDRPGLFMEAGYRHVYDLNAEFNAVFLHFLGHAPSAGVGGVLDHVRELENRRPVLAVWDTGFWVAAGSEPCAGTFMAEDGPFLCLP